MFVFYYSCTYICLSIIIVILNMEASRFKSKLSENKSLLIGKIITVSLVTKSGVERFSFDKLKDFGLKILELENLGAGFSFSTIENSLIVKRIQTDNEFNQWANKGVWTRINITASLIK